MKKIRLSAVVLSILTIVFYSCQKDDMNSTATGPSSLSVKIEAVNRSYSLPVSGIKSAEAESVIEWDTVRMLVSNVKFEAELKSTLTHRDSIEISYKWTGPMVADLLDTTISFGNFVLQPGFYDEIELKVVGSREDAHDMPVFYLSGTYTKDNTTIPVIVRVNESVSFKTEKDSVEVTSEALDFTGYIQIFLDQLMTGIQPSAFDNATLTGGVIIISSDKNRDVFKTFLHNLLRDHHGYFKHWHHYSKEHDDDEGEHD